MSKLIYKRDTYFVYSYIQDNNNCKHIYIYVLHPSPTRKDTKNLWEELGDQNLRGNNGSLVLDFDLFGCSSFYVDLALSRSRLFSICAGFNNCTTSVSRVNQRLVCLI